MAEDKITSINTAENGNAKDVEKKDKVVDDDLDDDDNEKNDEFEDGDKSKDSQNNFIVKLKAVPKFDLRADYITSMKKLLEELNFSPLDYRIPHVSCSWISVELFTVENEKKLIEIIGKKYSYEGRDLIVRSVVQGEKRVLDEETALDVMFKYRKLPYPQQLKKKTEEADEIIQEIVNTLKTSNTKFGKSLDRFPKLCEMIPMYPIDGYANEIRLTIEEDPKTNKVIVGLSVADDSLPYIIPIEKCRQIPRPISEAVQDFVDHLEEYGLKPYNRETSEGNVAGVFVQLNTACEIIMTVLIPSAKGITISKNTKKQPLPTEEEHDTAKEDGKSDCEQEDDKEDYGHYEEEEEEGEEERDDGDKKIDTDVGVKSENNKKDTGKIEREENGEEVKLNENEDDTQETGRDDKKTVEDKTALQELGDEDRLIQEENDAKIKGTKNMEIKERKQEIDAALTRYFNDRGQDFGIIAFYTSLTFYNEYKLAYEFFSYSNYAVGKKLLKESINGVQFTVTPIRPWSSRTEGHLQILSLIERLAHFDSNTVVGICSELRFLEAYFAGKCRSVVCIPPSNINSTTSKLAIRHGFRNIEFVSRGRMYGLKKTKLSRNADKVAIIWSGPRAPTFVAKKFYEMGCRQIILVNGSHKRKFQDIAKHVGSVGSNMAVTKIYGVDTHPHGDSYTLVALVEELGGGSKRRNSDRPLDVGVKRRSLQPLMNPWAAQQPWDNGSSSGHSQDLHSPSFSQMSDFMQNQLIFNEMMKQGMQQNQWGDGSDMRRQRGGDSRYGGGYGQRGIGGGGGNRNSRDSGNYNNRRRSNK